MPAKLLIAKAFDADSTAYDSSYLGLLSHAGLHDFQRLDMYLNNIGCRFGIFYFWRPARYHKLRPL